MAALAPPSMSRLGAALLHLCGLAPLGSVAVVLPPAPRPLAAEVGPGPVPRDFLRAPRAPEPESKLHRCAWAPREGRDAGAVYGAEDVAQLRRVWLSYGESVVTPQDCSYAGAENNVSIAGALKPDEDGYCHFGYLPQCSTAVRSRDYSVYAVAYSVVAVAAQQGDEGINLHCKGDYEAGDFRLAPGVFGFDAKLCYENGYLDLPDHGWQNFAHWTELARAECARLKADMPQWTNMTMDRNGCTDTSKQTSAMVAESRYPYEQRETKMPTRQQLLEHQVTKCAIWDPHGLACDMAYCRYNFCKLPDGRVGSGRQCRNDWLKPAHVDAAVLAGLNHKRELHSTRPDLAKRSEG